MANEKKSTMVKDALILFAITIIAALALGFVNELTAPVIAENAAKAKAEAYQEVFPGAAKIVDAEENVLLKEAVQDAAAILAEGGFVATINEACIVQNEAEEIIGYVVSVTTQGYKAMTLTFGYTVDGICTGLGYLAFDETPGIGDVVKSSDFTAQFVNKQADQFVKVPAATAENEINAISGASKSTNGVINGVNAGIYFLKELQSRLGGDE